MGILFNMHQADPVDQRIEDLEDKIAMQMQLVGDYTKLTEKQKIPYRVDAAELFAMRNFRDGHDLYASLENTVGEEWYSGAAGIKKAIQWLEERGLIQKQ